MSLCFVVLVGAADPSFSVPFSQFPSLPVQLPVRVKFSVYKARMCTLLAQHFSKSLPSPTFSSSNHAISFFPYVI